MLKSLATLLRRKPGPPASGKAPAVVDDTTQIFETLAMTDELRDALFPKSSQMISAIFDRPAPLGRGPASGPAPSHTPSSSGFSLPL
jgi:hypothetical protein